MEVVNESVFMIIGPTVKTNSSFQTRIPIATKAEQVGAPEDQR